MKKIKSTFETPDWYVQEEYDLLYKNLDLPTIYWNIFERLMLFQTQTYTEPPYDCEKFSKFMDYQGSILDYLEPKDGIKFFDLADNVYTEFSKITDKKIIDMEKGVQDILFLDNFEYNKSILHDKSLNLPGVHPLAYWEINEEVERINCLIENKPKFLGNKRGKNDKKINNSELEIVKLAKEVEPGYGNEYFHSYDFNVLNEIQELTKNNRNFIHDYLFTINPPDEKKIVDVRIDLTESDNLLKENFTKLLKSLRTKLNIESRKDKLIVNKEEGGLENSNIIIQQFKYYRPFEFFDLTFWTLLTNKRYTRETLADILYTDNQERCEAEGCFPMDSGYKCKVEGCYTNKCKTDILKQTIKLVKKYFSYNSDDLNSIQSQARAYLLNKDFSIKNK